MSGRLKNVLILTLYPIPIAANKLNGIKFIHQISKVISSSIEYYLVDFLKKYMHMYKITIENFKNRTFTCNFKAN